MAAGASITTSRSVEAGISYIKTTGQTIPNFKRRSRNGELLPHTYFRQFRLSGSGEAYYNVTRVDSSGTPTTNWEEGLWLADEGQAPWPSEALLESYINQSTDFYVQAAAARVYSQGHDTLTFIVELRKIKELFASTLKRLIEALADPRRGINLREISKDWLSWRYGWRTLIFDLNDLNDAIKSLDDKRTRFSERAGSSSTSEYISTSSGSFSSSYFEDVITDVVTLSLRGSVTADFAPSNFQFNPVQTAWELLPWSFVIDWIVSVGQAISALSFLTFSQNYAASGGTQVQLVRTYERRPTSWKAGYTFSSNNYWRKYTALATLQTRVPTSVPVLPQLKVRIDDLKVLDLIALLIQALK